MSPSRSLGPRRTPFARGVARPTIQHEANIASASIHFTLTTQLDRRIDIARAARRLLDSKVATSAAWPSETKIRVSKHLRQHARALMHVRSMYDRYEQARAEGTWKAAFRLALRHPWVGLMQARALWAPRVVADLNAFLAEPELKTLAWFLIRHPVIGVFKVLPNISMSRSTASRKGGGEDSGPEDFDPVVLDSPDENDGRAAETLDEAERLILDQQVVSAAERISDARLFGGPDRDEDRFVRLILRSTYHEFGVPGTDQSQRVTFEPRLLLHQSGVAQLDLALRADGPLTARQVLNLMWGPEPRIIRSEMPTPLLRGSEWVGQVTGYDDELDMGERLAHITHDVPMSMTDTLGAHLQPVLRVLRAGTTRWINYPVAILEPGDCCPAPRWKTNHADVVHRLAIRARGAGKVSPHASPPPDLSISAEHSLYATLGSSIYIQWDGESPQGIHELDTVLLLEYAVLTYVRLQSMEIEVSSLSLGERVLMRRYREALALFSELRQGNLRAGEARDVVRHVLNEMGADHMRSTIETALDLSGTAHETISSARASRRALWITALATVIAALVAVPTLRDLIDDASSQDLDGLPAVVLGPFEWAEALGFWGPWALLAASAALIIVLMTAGWLWRHRPRNLPAFRRGFAWPGEFQFNPPEIDFQTPRVKDDELSQDHPDDSGRSG